MHEKEIDIIPTSAAVTNPSTSSLMTRSVMESVSENLLMNISIRIRTLEGRVDSCRDSWCSLRDSLQLQHSTNLNIQRSQSTQRFNTNNLNTSTMSDTNRDDELLDNNNDSNYLEETNNCDNVICATGQDSIENNEDIINADDYQVATTDDASGPSSQMSLALNNLNQNSVDDNMTSLESVRQNITELSLTSDFDSIPGGIENKDCEYMKLVLKFKKTLVLPDAFFATDLPCCYCDACTKGGRIYLINGRLKTVLNVSIFDYPSFFLQAGYGSNLTSSLHHLELLVRLRVTIVNGRLLII